MASSPAKLNLKILAFVGSVREGRMAARVTKLVESFYKEKSDGHTLEIIDPEDLGLPVLKQPLHFYKDPTQAPDILHKINKKIQEADAFLLISAEYNRTIPPALSNTLNHFPPPSYEYKPSAVISYSMGPTGGIAASLALRPHLSELGCIPIKHMVTIPQVHKEVSEDGKTENAHITSSLGKSYAQIVWHGQSMKYMREVVGLPK